MEKSGYDMVKEFHQVFGHPVENVLQKQIFTDNPEKVKFRLSLISEEINEFLEACEKKDIVEAVDALADTMYVVYGTFLVLGQNYNNYDCAQYSVYSFRSKNDPYNIFKNEDKLAKLDIETQTLDSNYKNLEKACENKDMTNTLKYLDLIIASCYVLSSIFDVNIDNCFEEVHRSNMTKLCKSVDEANNTVFWYKKNNNIYKNVDHRKVDGKVNGKEYWVVYDVDTTKILKSINFELPNLKQFIKY